MLTISQLVGLNAAPPAGAPMVLVFDTSLESGEQITLPLYGTVNCSVDWGDGDSNDYTTTGDKTHTYSSGGTYTVEITGTLTQFGKGGAYGNSAKLTQCTSFGATGLTSLVGAFWGATNLTVVPATLPSTITVIAQAFYGATSFVSGVSGWDVTNVTNYFQAFNGATSFNDDLSSWDTENSGGFNTTFSGCTAFEGDGVANFDLSGMATLNSLNNFATGCTFTTANYDAILIAWEAAKAGYRNDVSPNFGSSTYTSGGAAATARAALVSYGWTITDGGTA